MKHITQVANILFDKYLKILKPSETVVLLIIIRKTIGWYDKKTKGRKERDWISYSQFEALTALSRKTIYNSLHSLFTKNIIRLTNSDGQALKWGSGETRIYYQCNFYYDSVVKKDSAVWYFLPSTTETPTKEIKESEERKSGMKRLSESRAFRALASFISNRNSCES